MAPNQEPGKQSSQDSTQDTLAEIFLKAVMTGGVAGGGLGAFWSLFKDSDIPKAIASAVIGLGISYAAKMLQPIHEGNQRRLEKVGKAVDSAIDGVAELALAKARGGTPEDRYLECQAMDCQALRSEGVAQHAGIFIPLLEEVFVPLDLAFGGSLAGFKANQVEVITSEPLSIWHFLARATQEPAFRQMVILAWGGYGKTTLLKHITYLYATRKHQKYKVPPLFPVLLVLRKYRDLLAKEDAAKLPELIANHYIPDLAGATDLKLSFDRIKDILKRGEAIVLLDGFDEVSKAQRPAVARWIKVQMHQYPKSVFILTSRPKAYSEQEPDDRLEFSTTLWVRNFNAEQRQDFVERWYLCQERYANGGRDTLDVQKSAKQAAKELLTQVEARQEIKDLAKNPLLLNMIVTFHRRYPGADLPKRRVELYREICQLQLKDRPATRKLDTLLTQCEAQTVLQMLALNMMQSRQEQLDRSALLQKLAEYLKFQNETVDAKDFLEQVTQISELLVEREPDEFEFAHLTFQEYLAATQIIQLNQANLLYSHLNDDWWKQTLFLYASQLKNPTDFIREVWQRGATEIAFTCLKETTKQVDAFLELELGALQKVIQSSRYQKLEDILKQQKWKEADYETYRLIVATVGKEYGQWLDKEDLINFPCEDLRAIDHLWVKYSNGNFGFSIQKKIYVECGAKLDGKYPIDEIWRKFGDQVGWRKNGQWLTYDDLNPYSLYPQGIFPVVAFGVCIWASGFWGGTWEGVHFFNRIENCRL